MTRVRGIMEKDVTTIPPNASVADLIQLLERHRITGVPVVDEQDILVGVVSQRDIVRLARDMEQVPEAMRWGIGVGGASEGVITEPAAGEFFAYYVTPTGGFVDVRDQIRGLPPDLFEGYRVEDIMTPAPVVIDAGASLSELARLLLDQEIHRALVVEAGKMVGIATTVDVLKAVAGA